VRSHLPHGPRLGLPPGPSDALDRRLLVTAAGDLTGRARPLGERTWQVAVSLGRRIAPGILEGVRRSLSLADDRWLRSPYGPCPACVVEIPAKLFEDRCG
jgi:hypothetical protein